MNQKDIIDISEDETGSLLRYESYLNGSDESDTSLKESDTIILDNIIEVDERQMTVSLFTYIQRPIPKKILNDLTETLMEINPEIKFGSFEIYTPTDSKKQFLRYRMSTCLKGIKVGKTESVTNMMDLVWINLTLVFMYLCENDQYKKWIVESK